MTRLGTIATSGGYRYTVDTVERGYRDPAEVPQTDRPYIGIVPGREDYVDTSGGQVEVTWQIVLACYLRATATTQAAIVAALSGFTSDVRKALYTSPQNLGVAGVATAHLLVVGLHDVAVAVTALDVRDAFDMDVNRFETPKTTTAQSDGLQGL